MLTEPADGILPFAEQYEAGSFSADKDPAGDAAGRVRARQWPKSTSAGSLSSMSPADRPTDTLKTPDGIRQRPLQ